MAINSDERARVTVSLKHEEIEVLEAVSKLNRYTKSDQLGILVMEYLKPIYDKMKEEEKSR